MSCRIALEFVSDQLPGWFSLSLQHLAKESLSGLLVASLGYQDVENISILIDCSPQVELLTLNLHEDFVYVPDVTAPPKFPSNLPSVFCPELRAPEPDRLVGDDDSTLGEQVFDIPKAECESMVEPDTMTNDLGRKTMTFVERIHSSIFSRAHQLDSALQKDIAQKSRSISESSSAKDSRS